LSGTSSTAAPRIWSALLIASAVVVVGAVPVSLTWWGFGAAAAQGVYVGLVVAVTLARTLPVRMQALSVVWLAVVSAAGALIGRQIVPLLIAVIFCCAVQVVFTRAGTGAVAVAPAIMVFWALFAPEGSALAVLISTLIGGAVLLLIVVAARMRPDPHPLSWSRAGPHVMLLAIGCAILLLLGPALGIERANWGLLVFGLVFLPATDSARSAVRFLAATAIGALAAVTIATIGPQWLVLTAIVVGAVCTVVATLRSQQAFSVASIAAMVVLLGALGPEASAATIGAERLVSALIAVVIAIALLALGRWAETRLSGILPAGRPTGEASWTP